MITQTNLIKNRFFNFLTILIAVFINFLYFHIFTIFQNDYLNPFTITFKNPKTLQMYNIIILYHYIMSFLYGIVIFTFIFIIFAFFRHYFFFHQKPKNNYLPQEIEIQEVFSISNFPYNLHLFINWIRYHLLKKKFEYMEFYKSDIKSSLTDQIDHAPRLEFAWVVLPAIFLIIIAWPSAVMLYYNEDFIEPVFNISVIGNQWYWTYEYNDFNVVEMFKKHVTHESAYLINSLNSITEELLSYMCSVEKSNQPLVSLRKFDRKLIEDLPRRISVDCNLIESPNPNFLRLLTTDQCLVIPAKTPVRLLVTSNDVIHSWAVPSYGVKMDAVPGRINQVILNVPLSGTSWGQCSELCGVNHAYMPIEVKVIPLPEFLFYIELKLKEILMPTFKEYYMKRVKIISNALYNINLIKEKGEDFDFIENDYPHLIKNVISIRRMRRLITVWPEAWEILVNDALIEAYERGMITKEEYLGKYNLHEGKLYEIITRGKKENWRFDDYKQEYCYPNGETVEFKFKAPFVDPDSLVVNKVKKTND